MELIQRLSIATLAAMLALGLLSIPPHEVRAQMANISAPIDELPGTYDLTDINGQKPSFTASLKISAVTPHSFTEHLYITSDSGSGSMNCYVTDKTNMPVPPEGLSGMLQETCTSDKTDVGNLGDPHPVQISLWDGSLLKINYIITAQTRTFVKKQ